MKNQKQTVTKQCMMIPGKCYMPEPMFLVSFQKLLFKHRNGLVVH